MVLRGLKKGHREILKNCAKNRSWHELTHMLRKIIKWIPTKKRFSQVPYMSWTFTIVYIFQISLKIFAIFWEKNWSFLEDKNLWNEWSVAEEEIKTEVLRGFVSVNLSLSFYHAVIYLSFPNKRHINSSFVLFFHATLLCIYNTVRICLNLKPVTVNLPLSLSLSLFFAVVAIS